MEAGGHQSIQLIRGARDAGRRRAVGDPRYLAWAGGWEQSRSRECAAWRGWYTRAGQRRQPWLAGAKGSNAHAGGAVQRACRGRHGEPLGVLCMKTRSFSGSDGGVRGKGAGAPRKEAASEVCTGQAVVQRRDGHVGKQQRRRRVK